jgi:hypothetical protein
MWLPVIWLLPVLTSLIYVLVEMLPQLFRGESVVSLEQACAAWQRDGVCQRRADVQWCRRGGQGELSPPQNWAARRPQRMFRPPKDPLREGMIHDKSKRAEEAHAIHRYYAAIDLFTSARQGSFADSPDIAFGLARAHFGRGDLDAALSLLDELLTGRPAFEPHAVAILKARVLAKQGEVAAALALLHAILGQTDNLEGRRLKAQYRRAEILWQSGAIDRAKGALTELTRHEQLFRINDEERHWIRLAGQALQAIS